jgi:DNA-directed RNA polymerase specialized sigma subunit
MIEGCRECERELMPEGMRQDLDKSGAAAKLMESELGRLQNKVKITVGMDERTWNFIKERSRFCPMSRMIVKHVEHGQDRETILGSAVLATLEANDDLREQLIKAIERRCPNMDAHQ